MSLISSVARRGRSPRGPSILSASLALACFGLLGCNDYTFFKKYPQNTKQAMRVVPAARPTPADILFVIDNSGSMANKQENLARNLKSFIEQIAGSGDYHIAVVSTDLDTITGSPPNAVENEMAGLVNFSFKQTAPFTLDNTSYDTTACMGTGLKHGCFRGPTADKRVITSAMGKDDQIATFKDNVRLGSCGSGIERGLAAMTLALSKTAPGQCNAGFLRQDANLVVVIVSDENDSDPAPPVDVHQYINDLKTYKSPSSIRTAVVVGAINGAAANCEIDPASGGPAACGSICNSRPPNGSHQACDARNPCRAGEYCDTNAHQCENKDLAFWDNCYWCSFYNAPDCCTALSANRYIDFAKALEQEIHNANNSIEITQCNGMPGQRIGCSIDSICQNEFDKTLIRIARDLILTNEYTLSPPATYPPGVVVKVDGKTLVYGTDFDVSSDGSKVSIKGMNTPKEGQTVEIYFIIPGDSP